MGSNKNQKQNQTVKKPKAVCQCYDQQTGKGCTHSPINGSLFCEHHQNCPGSPQSGNEPTLGAEYYNKPSVRRCHNCYSYAMDVHDPKGEQLCKKYGNCRNFFHQPGAKTGHRNALNKEERRSCPVVEKLMMGDVPEATKTTFNNKCPAGMSKIAAVVDDGLDYHWYRQLRTKKRSKTRWGHKDGSNKVKTFDALKRPIFNPELASRDYRWQGSDLNYEDFCGFYCVPRNHPVVLGRGVNVPAAAVKTRRAQRARRARGARKTARRVKGGQYSKPIPMTLQVGRGAQRGHGYDIRLNSLPSCPPRARKTRKARRGGGYDIRLNSLPSCPPQGGSLEPQGGLGLSWTNYPVHSTDELRKRYSMDTKSSRHH